MEICEHRVDARRPGAEKVKALTLTQPWASLMALQEKRVETRSWFLPKNVIGKEVAIHAAKGFPKWARETCHEEPFRSSLTMPLSGYYWDPAEHTGEVLCVVKFIGCRFTQDVRCQLTTKEIAFGDYADGRFAWFTEFVRLLEPVPAVGHLGFWDWDLR